MTSKAILLTKTLHNLFFLENLLLKITYTSMVLNQNKSKWIKMNQNSSLNNFWCLINLNNGNSRKPKRAGFRHELLMTVQHKFHVAHQLKWLVTRNCIFCKVSYLVKLRLNVFNQDIQSRGRLNNPLSFTRAYYFKRHSKNDSNPNAPCHLHCGRFGLC